MRWRSAISPTAARRRAVRAALAAPGARAVARRALELQQLLAQRGYYVGEPDGQFGGKTREALRSFQATIGTGARRFCLGIDPRTAARPVTPCGVGGEGTRPVPSSS